MNTFIPFKGNVLKTRRVPGRWRLQNSFWGLHRHASNALRDTFHSEATVGRPTVW